MSRKWHKPRSSTKPPEVTKASGNIILFTSGRYLHLPSLNQSRRQKVVEHPPTTSFVRHTIGCLLPLCCMHELSCPASDTWIDYLLQTFHKQLISCSSGAFVGTRGRYSPDPPLLPQHVCFPTYRLHSPTHLII